MIYRGEIFAETGGSMRTRRFELLRPDEILREKERRPIAYLPVGPLEWHGPHLPVGTDPLNAYAVATALAERNGGVVLPAFYWGTERERRPEMLKNIGFGGDEYIVGMDFPLNPMRSLYAREDAFGAAVREYLRMLAAQGYKLVVIVNGHGAENHIHTLRRLAAEFTAETDCAVWYTITTFLESGEQDFGHATKTETSLMGYLHPDCVDVSALPPSGTPLYNTAHAVVDHESFVGEPNASRAVIHDPRDYDAGYGKKVFEHSVAVISEKIDVLINSL